ACPPLVRNRRSKEYRVQSFPPAAAAFDAVSQCRQASAVLLRSAVLPRPAVLLAEVARPAVAQSASLPILPTAPRRTQAIRAAPQPGGARTNRAVSRPNPALVQMAENVGRLRKSRHRRGPAALHRASDHASHPLRSDQGRSAGPSGSQSACL